MRIIVAPLLVSFGLCALPLFALGCTKAGKCTRGEIGCATTLQGRCTSGAREVDGMCVEGDDSRAGSGGGSAGTGEPPTDCPDDSFANACEGFCAAMCSNQEALCLNSKCGGSDCGMEACQNACDNDKQCIARACRAQLEMTCETFGSKDDATGVFASFCFKNDPMCVVSPDLGCSDTCGNLSNRRGGQYANNGMCEDGGEGSTASTRCTRGTDCTDCGTRSCGAQGESCSRNGDCCGWTMGGSFCVDTGGGQICLATCSDDKPCAGTEMCISLKEGVNSVCVPQ
jgi:hypothetical protein